MFNPQICSRSDVNQTQATELYPDLFVTVNMDINIFLSCHSASNFSIVICHLFSSRKCFTFWTYYPRRAASAHHFMYSSLFKKKLFYFIYLFLAALGLHCCARAFSSCGEQGLLFIEVHGLLIVEHGLQARGLQQLQHTGSVAVAPGLQSAGSVVVAHELSCSMECGIFPDQGSNPCPLHWQVDS